MKLTKTHISFFRKRFEHWLDFWGILKQWSLTYRTEESDEYYAAVIPDHRNAMAVILLSSEWDDKEPTRKNIDLIAFHEAMHLVLAPLDPELAEIGWQHRIIRLLETQVLLKISRIK